ncbi:MAG TPA: periplasmic heavy metal sensor [Verrucomicrobiae bacterium]|jgi:Spy/CpxP family protein refolding chaperone
MKKILIFVILVGWLTLASAQNQAARQNAGDRFFPGLARVLTDAQRESLRAVLASQYAQIQPLEKKMRASRQALLDQIAGGNFNEDAAHQAAQTSADAEVELTVIYARALSQMTPPLSADQIQQIKNFQPGPGQFQRGGNAAEEGTSTPPPSHLPLPPELPHDSNGLPVVN